ncbi:MAG: hypothetical protein ABIJ97_02520 [Bacteroidota bacterium]
MKTKELTISTGNIHDPEMEAMMQKRDTELKEKAMKSAKFFAKKNLPAPKGDDLAQYTGELKTGYEKLATEINQRLQPGAHFPEARIDADFFKEQDKNLENEIKIREDQNRNDEYELGEFSQSTIPVRIRLTVISTLIITIGEVVFNTKAFQVTGESMLFALILSICISFAVFFFSHITSFLYKGVKNAIQKRLVIIGSLLIVSGLFTALAIFRSSYLQSHDVYINPFYFVIINLFFFIVSTTLSFFVLPSWSEIKENTSRLKTYYAIKKLKKEIEELKAKREQIKATILERTKVRLRIAHHVNYATDRIRKMYWETMEIFKTNNLTFRTDGITPDCFRKAQPEPDIYDFNYTVNSLSYKG